MIPAGAKMEWNKGPEINSHPGIQLINTGIRKHHGEKAILSISGAGKAGKTVKTMRFRHSYHI